MKSVEEKIRITDELTTRCAEYGQTLANQEVELKTFARIAEDKLAVEAEAKNLAHACEDLSVQLERLRTDLGESEHEKRTTLKALKDSNEEATILAKEREAVAAELDHQTIARGELISKHNRLEERSSELERALVAAEAARDLLTEQHRTATADTESIKRQFNAADADRTALKERTTSLQAALNEKVASEAAEREKSTQIIRGLHRDRDELDAKLGECESDNEKLAARIRALSHEKERADLQYQSALNEFRLASSANEHQAMQFVQCAEKVDELASRLHQVEESKAAVSAALGHAEATRDHLESDIHQLREDNVLLTSRLEAGANERSMLAAKLDADVTHELRRENRMLRDSLVETTAIAEQLRSQLLNKNASKEESERRSIEDMQSTLQLLRSTKEMLIEEDRRRGHMRSHIRHTEFHSSTHR